MTISNDDQAAIRKMLQDEEDFLVSKGMELRTVLLEGNDELTPEYLSGVTYGPYGLGGSFGGMPRTHSGVLQALLPGYIGEEDGVGECSETTDLSGPTGCFAGTGNGEEETTSQHASVYNSHPNLSGTLPGIIPMDVA